MEFKNPEEQYAIGSEYFNPLKNAFCTVTERHLEDEKELTAITVKYIGQEETAKIDSKDLSILKDKVPLKIRVLTKSGNKMTINSFVHLSDGIRNGLDNAMLCSGFKPNGFKVFHGKALLDKEKALRDLYTSDYELNFFACESLGKPKRWRRFADKYGDNTWSNSGRYHDRLYFVPQRDITFAGFSAWGPKDSPSYWMRYEVLLDDAPKIPKTTPKE